MDDQQRRGTRFLLYGIGFVVFQAAFFFLVLAVASTPWFLTHDGYPGMFQAGYSLRLQHQDCDVLIYGDSAALTGLDPAIVQKISGLKTCNISEAGGITEVVGSFFPLDAYLKNNKRPRFLLSMYTPRSNVDPYTIQPFAFYHPEGVLYGLQYDRSLEFYRGLLLRPVWLVNFTVWAGQSILDDWLAHHEPGPHPPDVDTRAQRASQNGRWTYPLPPETACVRTGSYIDPSLFGRYAASTDTMRKRYGTDGTRVVVDISPMANCDRLQDVYRRQSEGLHDNAFEVVPVSYFNQGDIHFSAEGATYISTKIGNQILALEREQDAQPAVATPSTGGGR